MLIDNIKVEVQEGVTEEEIATIVAEEKDIWAAKRKHIASINITVEDDELVVKSFERSPIKRIRRITGYLSTDDRFNDAKKAELRDRIVHI